ncbi:TPA: AAA family ATPase [Stenotrophomonas maltophilia]|nr:AAA family ATPase [Stenotrophomonas maltophilia]
MPNAEITVDRDWPIKSFSIKKLHGYRSVEINFTHRARILIAGNGAGKTTVLNALYWISTGRFDRLGSLPFESISLTLSDNRVIKLTHGDLPNLKGVAIPDEIAEAEISRSQLERFIAENWFIGAKSEDLRHLSVVSSLFSDTALTFDGITQLLNKIYESSSSSSSTLMKAKAAISSALEGIDVIHLPTYRRVEESLLGPKSSKSSFMLGLDKATSAKQKRERSAINYGLRDVISRLDEMADEIDSLSSLEYRNASATIIDDALNNAAFSGSALQDSLPDFPRLEQFLQRVSRVEHRNGNIPLWQRRAKKDLTDSGARRIEAIRGLYDSGEILKQQPPLLAYFLSKLKPVIETTQETAGKLQRFVNACNAYLEDSSEGKSFVYEPNSSKVSVISSDTQQPVPMDQLSSGEKQIISLLAELYLYDGSKVLLIDEPELSLSMEWQRKIIPDILNSGSVVQVVAITHSPFIFENELDPYAGPLIIRREKVQ